MYSKVSNNTFDNTNNDMELDPLNRQYYKKFVTLKMRAYIQQRFNPLKLKQAYKDNINFYLIPDNQWVAMEIDIKKMVDKALLKEHGQVWSLDLAVNIAKEAARMVVES